jgi:hypothetical protein
MSKEHRLTISICSLVLGAYCVLCALEFSSTFHGFVAFLCLVLAAVTCKGGKFLNADKRK